jgi:hypothetical protein
VPTTLPQMMAGSVAEAVEEGVEVGVRRGISRYLHPGIADKIGFGVGATILVVGRAAQSRRRRQERIERKLDMVAEQVEQVAPAQR